MREIPPVSAKLKALQDAMGAQLERQQKAKEKAAKATDKAISVEPKHEEYIPTIEDEYLMAQFQHGRYCGD